MKENFSKGVRNILKAAKEEAIRLKVSNIAPEHILLGIIKDKEGQANRMLRSLGCDMIEMKPMIEDLSSVSSSSIQISHIKFNQKAEKVLRVTFDEANKLNRKIANQIDLLLAITKEKNGVAYDVLKFYSIDYDIVNSYIYIDNPEAISSKDKKDDSKTPTLDLFSRDITELAKSNNLDPIIGRETEIERVAQISAMSSSLNCSCVPKCCDPLTSTRSMTVSSRSSR